MLALVAYSLKPVKLFSGLMQMDALLANNTQQCWELLALVVSVCMGLKNAKNMKVAHTAKVIITKANLF